MHVIAPRFTMFSSISKAVTVSPNKMTKKEMTKDLEFMAKEIRTRVIFVTN